MSFRKIFITALISSSSVLFGDIIFKVDDVKVTNKALKSSPVSSIIFKKYGNVEDFSEHDGKLVHTTHHAFVETISSAYANHYPLSISPDHIWLLICQGLSCHINQNPEKYRDILVNHQGKKDIVVVRDGFVKGSLNNDWEGVFPDFCQKMEKFMTPYAKEMLVTKFSTTGPLEQAAFEISMMETMQNYFSYLLLYICGIPEITLEGEVEDWELILKKIELLDKVELGWWTKELRPVIQEFVNAAKGKPNREFWQSIFKEKSVGCGNTAVSGWINYFFPYLQSGLNGEFTKNPIFDEKVNLKELQTGLESFPDGMSSAPFIWEQREGLYNMKFLAGFIATGQEDETMALRPEIGWIVQEDINEIDTNKALTESYGPFEDILKRMMKSVNKVIVVDNTKKGDEQSVTIELSNTEADELCKLFVSKEQPLMVLDSSPVGSLLFKLYREDKLISSFNLNRGNVVRNMPYWFGSTLTEKSCLNIYNWLLKHGLKRPASYNKYLQKYSAERIDKKMFTASTLSDIDKLRETRYPIQRKFISKFFTTDQLKHPANIFESSALTIGDKITLVYWIVDEYEKNGVFFNNALYEVIVKENRNITEVDFVRFYLEGEAGQPYYDKISKKILNLATSYSSREAFKKKIPEPDYYKLCSKLVRACCQNGTIWDELYFFCRLENELVRHEFVTALFELLKKMDLDSIDKDKIWSLNYYFFSSKDGYKIMNSKFSEEEICKLKSKWLEYCTTHDKYLEEAFKFAFKGNHKFFLKEFIKKADAMKEKPDYYNFIKLATKMKIYDSYSSFYDAFAIIRGKVEEIAAKKKLHGDIIENAMYQNMIADLQGESVVGNAEQFWEKVEKEHGSILSYNRNFIVTEKEKNRNSADDVYYLLNNQGEKIYAEGFKNCEIYPDYYKYLDFALDGYDFIEPKDLPLDQLQNGRIIALLTDLKSNQFVVKVNDGKLEKETVPKEFAIEKIVDDKLLFSDSSDLIGVMDHNCKILRKPKYSDVGWFVEGFCPFEIDPNKSEYFDEMCGFLDKNFNEVIKASYCDVDEFMKGLSTVSVKVEDKVLDGIINKEGCFVVTPAYDYLYQYESGLFFARKNDKWGVIDKTGKEIVPIKYPVHVEWIDGYTVIDFGGKYGILDPKGEPLNLKME